MVGRGEMQHHRLSDDIERRFLLVFDDGDEIVEELARFASEQGIEAAEFTGIGSFARLRLDGDRRPTGSDVHSLDGQLAVADGVPHVDAYVVVSSASGERCAGRLLHGVVRDVLKLVFTEDYSGSRASPSSTETRPSPRSERTAS